MNVPLWNTFSARARKRMVWAAALVLFYTLFGFLILPVIVKAVAVKQAAKLFDREVTIDKVRINPYALSATVRGLVIKDKDGEPFISWQEFYANIQLASLFGRTWVFKEIHLTQPYARVQVGKDRSLNFSDLLAKFSQTSREPAAPPKPLLVRIDRLQITGALASVTDLTPSTPFRRTIGPVEIMLTDFRTDPSSRNPYSFSGTTDGGEKFTWSGYFFLAPIRSEGELTLEGLSIPKYAPLYHDLVRFDIKDGVVDFRSAYRFGLSASNYTASVSDASFTLKSLKLAPASAADNMIELDRLSVSGVTADAVARTAEVGTVDVAGGRLSLKRARDATVNLIEASRPADTATNAPGGILLLLHAATNAFAALLKSTNLWSATLDRVSATNCALAWEDLVNSRPVRLSLEDIAVEAEHLSNVRGSNMTLGASLRWNTNGMVRVNSTAQIDPPAADVDLKVDGLELNPLDPYLEPFLNVFILGSKVGLDGRVSLRMATNSLPEVAFRGDVRLDDFNSADAAMNSELVKWKSVRISGIDAALNPPAVAVNEIALIEPLARITIETNRTINLLTAIKFGDTNAAAPEAASPSIEVSTTPGRKTGLGQKFGGLLRETLAGSTNGAALPLLPRITVGTIAITNAGVLFDDLSARPPVKVSFQDINGTIAGVSSEELKRADVHLSGKMGRAGPVEIAGRINPLNQNAPTELQVTLHNVDLSPASPYSGRFLGYGLSRGRLDLKVNYEVSQRTIKAKNVVVLDQFTFGAKVNSPDATKLPVRLAVAILKDRNGRIELDVPIEGNLDDPKFHFGHVIGRAIGNIITKLVTSPFSALGALFGGKGEEVSFQDFAPGSAELQAANLEKLHSLVNGLHERPGLQLQIEGGYDPVADRDALRKQKLAEQFRQQKWAALRKSEQARINPEEIILAAEEYDALLRAEYNALVQSKADAGAPAAPAPDARPSATAGGRNTAPKKGRFEKGAMLLVNNPMNVAEFAAPDEMERLVLESVAVTDDDLRQLAAQRAQRVQKEILDTGKIEAERIVLAAEGTGGTTNRASRVYFHLE
jgi:hypothetical protein